MDAADRAALDAANAEIEARYQELVARFAQGSDAARYRAILAHIKPYLGSAVGATTEHMLAWDILWLLGRRLDP